MKKFVLAWLIVKGLFILIVALNLSQADGQGGAGSGTGANSTTSGTAGSSGTNNSFGTSAGTNSGAPGHNPDFGSAEGTLTIASPNSTRSEPGNPQQPSGQLQAIPLESQPTPLDFGDDNTIGGSSSGRYRLRIEHYRLNGLPDAGRRDDAAIGRETSTSARNNYFTSRSATSNTREVRTSP